MMKGEVVLLVVLAVAGCGGPTPSSAPAHAEAVVDGFQLVFDLPKSVWRADEAITGQATLRLLGDGPTTISGSGSNIFTFEFEGAGLHVNPVQTASCARYSIDSQSPITSDIRKSGAFDRDDPNHDFYIRWFHDPELHLPPGEWRVVATALFHEGSECEGRRWMLATPVTLTVLD